MPIDPANHDTPQTRRSLWSASMRTATWRSRLAAGISISIAAPYLATIPLFIGCTLGERGSAGVGGGGMGLTWGRPQDTGYYSTPGFHIHPRGWTINGWQWEFDRENEQASVPLWPFLAAALTPLAWHALRIRHRHRRGTCLWCGYPLPNLPQCPECGRD